MKPIDRTAPAQSEAITFDFDLPHRPEKVWRALTEPALLGEWLLPVIGLTLETGTNIMRRPIFSATIALAFAAAFGTAATAGPLDVAGASVTAQMSVSNLPPVVSMPAPLSLTSTKPFGVFLTSRPVPAP